MTRHPTARRVHSSRNEPDDAFVARLLELTTWAKANARTLGVIGAVLVVAVVAGLVYRNNQLMIRERAQQQLAQIQQTTMAGNNALAIRDLETLLAGRLGETDAGREGRLMLAQLYLGEGNTQKAAEAVEPLARELTTPLGVPAAFLLAAAYEGAGTSDEAEAVYLRIAENAPYDYQRNEALAAAARLRAEAGDMAGASDLYERLVDVTEPNSPERALYELRLAEARAAS